MLFGDESSPAPPPAAAGNEPLAARMRPRSFAEFEGQSHIIAKHGIESVEDVIETIARGKIVRTRPGRVNVQLKDTIASLVLESRGKRETWILTGFTKEKPTGFFNLRQLTGPVFFKGNQGVPR